MYSFLLSTSSTVFFAIMTGLALATASQMPQHDAATYHLVAMITGVLTVLSLLVALAFAGDLDKRKG